MIYDVFIVMTIKIKMLPFGFEGRMWDLIVSVPDHCLSFYFTQKIKKKLPQCHLQGRL